MFANNEDDLDYSPSWMWTLEDGHKLYFPQEQGLIHGTWMKIRIRLGTLNWDRDPLPLVDSLRVVTRDVSPVIGSLYEGEGMGYADLKEEEKEPEDLQGALREIRKLKEYVREIKRATHYFGGVTSMSHHVRRNAEQLAKLYDYTFKDPEKDQLYLTNPIALGIAAHRRIDQLQKDLTDG